MNVSAESGPSRREFIGRLIPACAMTCLGLGTLPLLGKSGEQAASPPPAKHKFDAEVPRKLSYRQIFEIEYGNDFIPLLQFLAKNLGDEKAVEMLKKFSAGRAVESAPLAAKRAKGNDFAALKTILDPSSPQFQQVLTVTVTESSDKVHALKATECLWAKTFLDAKAGELGYAAVCYGDYAFARAFNPQVEMVRTKTLMQGMDCCDHKYLWRG